MSRALTKATDNAIRFFRDKPTEKPSEWCEKNLWFDEDDNRGPFTFSGSEYCRELVDDFGSVAVNDSVAVFGSQARKTGSLMGGVAWCLENDPCGMMWVFPNENLAAKFTKKRWIPMLKRSEVTRVLIPTKGTERYDFTTLDQKLGASSIFFCGSHSEANLSSNPRRRVVLDEVDKFDTGRNEADAANLAEQRTKGQPNPQRFKTSTPTVLEGLIWQEAKKGDLRRYFIPCALCGRHHPSSRRIVLAWSPAYTIFAKKGNEAFVFWDKEAKRKDGTWDLDRVERSAHFKCPHCGGQLVDANKTWMNREGLWIPTQNAASGFVSRHLPSLYACTPETNVGKLAKKFLEQKFSLVGPQGFINGDLAEPYQMQDKQSERVELITSRIEVGATFTTLMSADAQYKSPHFWFVKRAFSDKECIGVSAGSAENWDDLKAAQGGALGWLISSSDLKKPEEIRKEFSVPNECVIVDSGWGAIADAQVYANCAINSDIVPRVFPQKPILIGWCPAKGFPMRKRWKEKETGLMMPYNLVSHDPFVGLTQQGQVEQNLFEFSGEYFKDILQALRADKEGKLGVKWSILDSVDNELYWRHLDCKIKGQYFNHRTNKEMYGWHKRHKDWPDHLDDCEIQVLAFAARLSILRIPIDLLTKE